MPFLLPKEAGLDLSDNEIDQINDFNNADIYTPSGLNKVFYDSEKKSRKRKHVSVNKLEHILEDLKADSDIEDSEDEIPKEEKIDHMANHYAIKKIREREELEEETFTRTVLTKKQKKLEEKLSRGEYIDPDIEGEQIMNLLNDEEDKDAGARRFQKSKKKKNHKQKKGFKNKGKRFKK